MPYKWCLQEHKEKGDSVGTNVSNSFPSRGCLFMVLQPDPYNQIEKSISFQANYFPSDKLLRFMTLLYSLELVLVWKIKSIVQGGDIRVYRVPPLIYIDSFCAVDFAKRSISTFQTLGPTWIGRWFIYLDGSK
jgi:hypothetical protein